MCSPRPAGADLPRASVQGPARTNGLIGLDSDVDAADWQLRIQHEGRGAEQTIGLQAVQGLPRIDLVTELKCVEGWSEVMHFGGVRFLDFVTQFGLATRSGRAPDPEGNPQDLYRYVYLATPNEDYYVGLDMASALHPQTLLCDTMNGQPLTRRARGAAAALPGGEIRLQEPQTHRPDPLPGRTARRLLGRPGLRLVRGFMKSPIPPLSHFAIVCRGGHKPEAPAKDAAGLRWRLRLVSTSTANRTLF